MKNFLVLFLSVTCLSTTSAASDFRWNLLNGTESKTIGDDEYKFAAGDWNCVISQVTKDKSSKSETRRLGCSQGDGLQVYIAPRCGSHIVTKEKVHSDVASFNLQQKKTGSQLIVWSCTK